MIGRNGGRFSVGAILLVFACLAALTACASWQNRLTFGAGKFVYTGTADARLPAITVWYYRPTTWQPDDPIVFVMHGNTRSAESYRAAWMPEAERRGMLLIVPEFAREHYQKSEQYHQGNVIRSGAVVDSAQWTFNAIERLFDDVKGRTGSTRSTYRIYGHSAGAQFVHRMVLLMPQARIERAVAANAGWYTIPNPIVQYPYGLNGVIDSRHAERQLGAAFARDLTILLGTNDTDTSHAELRTTPEAMAQGRHRFARGQNFYTSARRVAQDMQLPFHWRLRTVPGAAHDNKEMVAAAAVVLAD